ncbi:MAG: TonB-dependent receptor [Pseudanabaena sp. ELA607]
MGVIRDMVMGNVVLLRHCRFQVGLVAGLSLIALDGAWAVAGSEHQTTNSHKEPPAFGLGVDETLNLTGGNFSPNSFPIAQTPVKKPQSVPSSPEVEQINLEVTGQKAPFVPSAAPTYVIPRQEIEQQRPRSASELLRTTPGFAINDYGFGADIHTGTFLRGFAINQSAFQINGRSFGSNVNTYHGGTDLNSIPVEAIERVEVKSGTAATLYGSEAFGGVVNIMTKQEPQTPRANAGVELGSYGLQRYRLSYGGTFDGVTLRLGYERFSNDNNYPVPIGAANRNPLTGKLVNGDTSIDNFFGQISQAIDKNNTLSFDAFKVASRRGLIYFGANPNNGTNLQYDRLNHDLTNIGATWVSKLAGDDSVITANLGFNQDFFNTYGPRNNVNQRLGTLDSRAILGRVEHRWRINPSYQLTWGTDIKSNNIDGTVFASDLNATFNTIAKKNRFEGALFALNTWYPIDKVQLEAGLRYTSTNDFGDYLNPTLGARWQITPEIAFRSSFAALQRNPGLDQLYVPDSIHGWLPNPNLRPERGTTWTAGFDINPTDNLQAQFTYFNSNFNNRLGIIGNQWQNVGVVNTNGLEAALKWRAMRDVTTFLTYTYTDAFIASSLTASEVGLQLSTIPYAVARAGVTYEANGWQATLGLSYSSGARRAVNAAPGVSSLTYSPAWASLDFNFRVPVTRNLAITVALENLTDVSYEKVNRLYQPGLTYRLGVQASF